MGKEQHVVRVWGWRDGHRRLEFSEDALDARARALDRIEALKGDESVQRIEMREHVVLSDDLDVPGGRRGSLRWERGGGGWRMLAGRRVRSS